MMNTEKQTIYVDVDDEITAIIDKVKTSSGKIIALVLPKRATVLQSIVNMKLLKKSALGAKKNLVLITSEAGLMPLAGAVGLHVAASLQSKPAIPLQPIQADTETAEISEVSDNEPDVEIDTSSAVGTLAASSAVLDDDTETIELGEDDTDNTEPSGKKVKKSKQKKGFKVPNFDRFRLGFFLAILAVILLIGGWIFGAIILPKATVAITTDSSTTLSKIDFTANTAAQDLVVDKALVPAVLKEIKKTDTEKTTATGQKDMGTKASGTVTLSIPCSSVSGAPPTIPAGTGVSATGLTFITSSDASLTTPSFSGGCKFTGSTAVTAQNAGDKYNVAAGLTFTVAGYSAVTGTNSAAFSGGTTNIIKVVSQSDIDIAAAKMKGRLDADAKKELATQIKADSLTAIDDTMLTSAPAVTASPAVDSEASGPVTVTAITTYSVIGVKASYLSQLIKKDVAAKIDTTKQTILDDGLDAAVIRLSSRKSPSELLLSMQSIVVAGPQLNAETIKEEIKGKKRGDAERIINAKVGVKDVTISYSPFWVVSTPKSVKKIMVTIQKPEVTKKPGSVVK